MESKETIVRKWRVQQANKFGATMVAYIDARDVSKELDKKFPKGWSNEFIEVAGKLFCRITDLETGIHHEDVGTPSNIEKVKGEASDAFKRAAVHFGVGRDNYELPVIKLPTKEYNGKYYPCDKTGKFLKDQALLDACETELKKLS